MDAAEQTTVLQLADAERDEPLARAPSGNTADPSHWWLPTAWLRHHNTIEDVHPLLVGLQYGRGTGFMTPEHIVAALDAKNPDALVRGWIQAAPTAARPQGNPETLPVIPDA